MKTIYKYLLKTEDYQLINIHKNAKLLTVQIQQGVPCLWALVETDEKTEDINILTRGTGHRIIETDIEYVGTYQLLGGGLIFHVFKAV